jgi:hypothetical protein
MAIRIARNSGMLLLGVWLILSGLTSLLGLIGLPGPLLAVLAIVAGVLILLGR